MDVFLDDAILGTFENAGALRTALTADQLEQIVCTRLDGVDSTLDGVLDGEGWDAKKAALYTFPGWLNEASRQVLERLGRLRASASDIIVMSGDHNPMDLLDDLVLKPKEILGELMEIKEHLGPEVAAALDEVAALMAGGETAVTLAVRAKDFVCLADALRLEWSLVLRSMCGFLDPDHPFEIPPSEVGVPLEAEALFEANLAALEPVYPLLISPIRAAWGARDEDQYGFAYGPSGIRSPVINGQRVWSVMEPGADADRIALEHEADLPFQNWDSSITWGLPGDQAFRVLESEMEGRPKIFVRPDLVALAAELHCVDWRPLVESSTVVLTTTVEEYRWTLRTCFVHEDRVRRLSSPNLLQVDPALYVELHEESGHTLLARSMEDHTGVSRGRQWASNALANVHCLLPEPDAHNLKDLRKGLPGLLVAPGPSLKKNIHLIPEFAKKGVVVGVSHVLGKLQKLGVDPELIVAIEGNDISDHFKDTDPARTSLFCHESTHPEVASQPVAQRWVVHDCEVGAQLRPEENLHTVSMLASSCTQVAMWALKHMGCNPIIFVGLDLALEDGRQYSDGCEGWTPAQSTLEVEGYHGGTVQTLAQYNVFRDQFELSFGHEEFSGVRFINATEGGAKLRGIDQQSLGEVIADLQGAPDRTDSGPIRAAEEHLPVVDWSEVAALLDQSAADLKDAEESANKGIRATRHAIRCFKAGDEAGVARRGRAAAKRAKRANEVLTENGVLSGRWMAAQNRRSARHDREALYIKDDPKAQMRHNLAHYHQLLAALEEAAASLRPHYEEAAERIRKEHHV